MARVLVVDDDPDVRKLVQVWLRRGGHQVIAVASGAEALETVDAKGAPDLIVADVTMPEMSGLELVEQLRERSPDNGEEVPVVFLSARVLPDDIEAGEALGARYLTKPFMGNVLLDVVDQMCPPPKEDYGDEASGW